MVLSSLYEFSARRSAALEESGGEAAAFILLDVKKRTILHLLEKKLQVRRFRQIRAGGSVQSGRRFFTEDGILHTGSESAAFASAFIHLVKKKLRGGAESRPFVD